MAIAQILLPTPLQPYEDQALQSLARATRPHHHASQATSKRHHHTSQVQGDGGHQLRGGKVRRHLLRHYLQGT